MDARKKAEYIKKYYNFINITTKILILALIIILKVLKYSFFLTIPIAILLVTIDTLLFFSIHMKIGNILTAEMEPYIFKDIYDNIYKIYKYKPNSKKPDEYLIMFEFYTGDYESVIIRTGDCEKITEPEILSYYLQSQFFLSNLSEVQKARDKICKNKNDYLKKKITACYEYNFCVISEFACFYLNQKYDKALEACKQFVQPPKNMKILKLYSDFYTALCYEALGENEKSEKSQEMFKEIYEKGYPLALTNEAKKRIK